VWCAGGRRGNGYLDLAYRLSNECKRGGGRGGRRERRGMVVWMAPSARSTSAGPPRRIGVIATNEKVAWRGGGLSMEDEAGRSGCLSSSSCVCVQCVLSV
jgi:hypothetical protein